MRGPDDEPLDNIDEGLGGETGEILDQQYLLNDDDEKQRCEATHHFKSFQEIKRRKIYNIFFSKTNS